MGHSNKIFDFLKNNGFSLLTVAFAAIVIGIDQIGSISELAIQRSILALLLLLATSELVERKRKLNKISEQVERLPIEISETLEGVHVRTFSRADEAQKHFAKAINAAQISICQASIDIRRSRRTEQSDKLDACRDKKIKRDIIKYRYVASLNDTRRLETGKSYILDQSLSKFYAKYYISKPPSIPLMNFTIIDDSEVLIRCPYDHGQDPIYLAIINTEITQLFLSYFEVLWKEAKELRNKKDFDEILDIYNSNQ